MIVWLREDLVLEKELLIGKRSIFSVGATFVISNGRRAVGRDEDRG